MCVWGGGGGGGFSARDPNTPSLILWRKKYFVFIFYSTPIQMSMSYATYISLRSWVRQPPPPSVGIWFVHEYIYAYEPRIARILSTPILCCLELCHRLRPWVDEWGVSAAISTPPPPIGIRIWLNCCFVYICIRSSIAKILATPMHSLWVTPRILVYDHGMINEGWVGQGPTSPPPPPLLGFYSCTCIRSPIARFLAEPMHACV